MRRNRNPDTGRRVARPDHLGPISTTFEDNSILFDLNPIVRLFQKRNSGLNKTGRNVGRSSSLRAAFRFELLEKRDGVRNEPLAIFGRHFRDEPVLGSERGDRLIVLQSPAIVLNGDR